MRAAVEEAAQVVCFEAAFALFVSLVLLQCHVLSWALAGGGSSVSCGGL